ncbi:MAG: hydrogenase maturation protease [Caldilineaceae bacterium]|nr:hydrogenase maturation protease [Caldilineaceae bacterium]
MTRVAGERSQEPAPIVVIGYGNTFRRDDGAGVALAEKLVAHWIAQGRAVRLLTSTQLLPEMAADISHDAIDAVVFVDAAANDLQSGIQIAKVEAGPTSPSSGHNLDATTLLVYANLLYGHCPRAWLVTVPGTDFVHGQGFSPRVTQWLTNDHDIAAIASQLFAEIEIKESSQCTNLELPNA